jgi:hypothetical protein
MSEWYDNQNRSSSKLKELLQERLDKVNQRSTLAAKEAKRLNRLEAIADKLMLVECVKKVSYRPE